MFGFLKKLMGMPNDEVLQQYKEKGAVIIDVRTPAEYKGGHPKKAQNIPLQNIQREADKIKKMNKPIILCCASGARSGQATSILKGKGIDAVNAGAWQNVANLMA